MPSFCRWVDKGGELRRGVGGEEEGRADREMENHPSVFRPVLYGWSPYRPKRETRVRITTPMVREELQGTRTRITYPLGQHRRPNVCDGDAIFSAPSGISLDSQAAPEQFSPLFFVVIHTIWDGVSKKKSERNDSLRVGLDRHRSDAIGSTEGGDGPAPTSGHPKAGVGARKTEAKIQKRKEVAALIAAARSLLRYETLAASNCKVSFRLLATRSGRKSDRKDHFGRNHLPKAKQGRLRDMVTPCVPDPTGSVPFIDLLRNCGVESTRMKKSKHSSLALTSQQFDFLPFFFLSVFLLIFVH